MYVRTNKLVTVEEVYLLLNVVQLLLKLLDVGVVGVFVSVIHCVQVFDADRIVCYSVQTTRSGGFGHVSLLCYVFVANFCAAAYLHQIRLRNILSKTYKSFLR